MSGRGLKLAAVMLSPILACAAGGCPPAQAQAQAQAQASDARKAQLRPNYRRMAPIDLTGYWVAVIDTDWRWRMVTPPKGDFAWVPITIAAQKVMDHWDPAGDEAAGEQCRAYGAAGLMRIPTRLHITWPDDATLRVDTDAGMQTRLLRFAPSRQHPAREAPTWQGDSVANWEVASGSAAADTGAPKFGSLHVVTTHMRAGYLRRNGVPYSANAVLTEDWDLMQEPGADWVVILTTVVDPTYLRMPYLTSPVFKREPDGSKWNPSPCRAK
jgi:hypothetical protein